MTKLILLGLLATACERSEQRAAPAPQVRDAATSGDAVHVGVREGHLRSTGEELDLPNLLGQGCTRGTEEPYPQLPYPVGIPAGNLIVTWCRDGALAFHLDGTKAADGKLVRGEPDGPWVYYSERGTRLVAGSYAVGKPDGLWRVFNDEGATTQLGCFVRGVKRWRTHGDVATEACPPALSR